MIVAQKIGSSSSWFVKHQYFPRVLDVLMKFLCQFGVGIDLSLDYVQCAIAFCAFVYGYAVAILAYRIFLSGWTPFRV